MKWLMAASEEILSGARKAMTELDLERVESFVQHILDSKTKKIFVGETVTPAAVKDDLIIAISGSGTTKITLTASSTAKEIGARVIAVTSYPESPLGNLADLAMPIGGRTKLGWPTEEDYLVRQILGESETLSPLGSIFENNCMIFLDSMVVELMHRLGKTEDEMRKLHATLE
jgi:6-phospho-3-hexuloisomerase